MSKNGTDMSLLIERKIDFFRDILQKTVQHAQKQKTLDVLGINEVSTCIQLLMNLSDSLNKVTTSCDEAMIESLQTINNELSSCFKTFGTECFDDFLTVCFGNNIVASFVDADDYQGKQILELLKKHFHPIGYKMVKPATQAGKLLEVEDVPLGTKAFHVKVHGLQVTMFDKKKKGLQIIGILDDVQMNMVRNDYLTEKMRQVTTQPPQEVRLEMYQVFLKTLTLKDYMICSPQDIHHKYVGYVSVLNEIKNKQTNEIVKEFIAAPLFAKRLTLIQLLLNPSRIENQYLAYLLYDLLSNDAGGSVDSVEQSILFDSFPFVIRQLFKDAMRKTVQYTTEITNYDASKVPLEQQICLMKADDDVKEKAMRRLRELKTKADDSGGGKARQYLEGLLRIPFSVFRREPILRVMDENRALFADLLKTHPFQEGEIEQPFTSLQILQHLRTIRQRTQNDVCWEQVDAEVACMKRSALKHLLQKTTTSSTTKVEALRTAVQQHLRTLSADEVRRLFPKSISPAIAAQKLPPEVAKIEHNYEKIRAFLKETKDTLDESVYGHDTAKTQIARIIGQWINGETDGYCFGFEGPPGVGKTTLAKYGLSNCLKDENGVGRPFAMIQIGGDSNAVTLLGHSYTYTSSSWGAIAQILMDKKCMNPIILIDEVDKISKTENGKEIIGVLTHLLDPTQNDCFQEKYFAGINLDLSKALFVLSYNDVNSIDRIMLDRVHRIQFDPLSLEDKLVVVKEHLLPELYRKMGLVGMIEFADEVIQHIVEEFTNEPGVRKLKELLFEIVAEINMDILTRTDNVMYEYPIQVTREALRTKYLKDKPEQRHKKTHKLPMVGVISGLWANAVGGGGIIPIQANWFPASQLLTLKLTGSQGEIMKESMNVALTLAWKLTSPERQKVCTELAQGVHIHCPEGAVPKDGPSAGTAITVALYSLFSDRRIRNDVAITGEITLDGSITEIGGLELKILGGIRAGVKTFLFPSENEKEFQLFVQKQQQKNAARLLDGIVFRKISHISEVLDIVFCSE